MTTERTKKLYRSRTNRILFGVCGGLGDFFGIDPVFVRLILILLSLLEGMSVAVTSIGLYLFLALTIPNEPKSAHTDRDMSTFKKRIGDMTQSLAEKLRDDKPAHAMKRNTVALIIIAFGLFALARPDRFTNEWLKSDLVWPTALVILGFYFVFRYNRH